LRLSSVSLGCWFAQGRLRIHAGPNLSSYLIRQRFEGSCEYRLAGESVLLSSRWSVVQSPEDVADITGGETSDILGFSIDADAVVREMEARLGHTLGAPLRFAPAMNMQTAPARAFRAELLRLCGKLDQNPMRYPVSSLAVRQMERNLVSLLVEGQRSNYTRLLHREKHGSPSQVRYVEEYIREHASQPMSLGDLAVLAGVSARTLQFSFRKSRGCTPMQFLRATRLDRVRQDLLAERCSSVTCIATKWGFLHFGRFAADYRSRFGEPPSATLRRGKLQLSSKNAVS